MKVKKIAVEVEAYRWLKNGDHPLDGPAGKEGGVVRYYRHPADSGDRVCDKCVSPMEKHGWIDTLEGGHIVCVGDFIITGVEGEKYPCKPSVFWKTYEEVLGGVYA